MTDPGHLDAATEAPRRRGRACALVAIALAVVAALLAALPVASFFAGLPALAAVVLAVVAVVLGARRAVPVVAAVLAVVALAVAVPVSLQRIGGQLERFAQDLPTGGADGGAAGGGAGGSGQGETDALGAGPHRVVYEVLGTGTARITYTVFAAGASGGSAEGAVTVPHARTQRLTVPEGQDGGAARFSMVALAGGSGDEIGCRISIDGRVVAERAATTGRAAACVAVAG